MGQFSGRNRGSARFEPYYKLSWYDTQALAWREIQRSYPTMQAAADAVCEFAGRSVVASRSEHINIAIPTDAKWRIVTVKEQGRETVALGFTGH